MLSVHEYSPASVITVSRDRLVLPDAVEQEVERLWVQEKAARGADLVNRQLLCAVTVQPRAIGARIVEYRHFIAQQRNPALFDILKIRPLAVSGVLECPEGLVLGRRAGTLTQDAGLWELVPSGGMDPAQAATGDTADCVAQVLVELQEETGLGAGSVAVVQPFCLVEDSHSHVIDIGIAMTTTLNAAALREIHRAGTSGEYSELRIVPASEAASLGGLEKSNLAAVSAVLLARFRDVRMRAMRP